MGMWLMYVQVVVLQCEAYTKKTVVAKSETPRKDLAVNNLHLSIGREAYHLAQLNSRSSGTIVGLRGYKYLTGDHSVVNDVPFQPRPGEDFPQPLYQEWRSFLELCDCGNLYGLLLKYKAWGYHLPEAFIWWAFLQLMLASRSMDTDPNKSFRHEAAVMFGAPWDGSFMLHHDMKEENIFVKSHPETMAWGLPYKAYPMLQLADFGLSQVTTINNPTNRAGKIVRLGTESYLAPERRRLEKQSSFYPFTEHLPRDPPRDANGVPVDKARHPIGPEANVWGVGAIIYLLMTLQDGEQLSQLVNDKLNYSDPMKTLPEGDFDLLSPNDFGHGAASPTSDDYSPQLKRAVIMCTRIQPSQRPSAASMIAPLQGLMATEATRLRHEFDGDQRVIFENTRLNLTHDDWNQTPAGPFCTNFCVSHTPPAHRPLDAPWLSYFWGEFWRHCDKFAHPNDARLIPPTACQPIDVGPNYQNRDYLGSSRVYGQRDEVVYYPYQYNQPPHSYHSRTFFPPGGRAIKPRTVAEQRAPTQQQMTQAQQWSAQHPVASQAILDHITRQETAFAQQQQQQREMQRQRVAVPQQAVRPALGIQQDPIGRPQRFVPAQPTPLQQMQMQMQQQQMLQTGILPIPTGLPPSMQQWHIQRTGVPVNGDVPQPSLQPQPRPLQQWHPQATIVQEAQWQEALQRQAHGGGTAESPFTVDSDSEPEWLKNYDPDMEF